MSFSCLQLLHIFLRSCKPVTNSSNFASASVLGVFRDCRFTRDSATYPGVRGGTSRALVRPYSKAKFIADFVLIFCVIWLIASLVTCATCTVSMHGWKTQVSRCSKCLNISCEFSLEFHPLQTVSRKVFWRSRSVKRNFQAFLVELDTRPSQRYEKRFAKA